MDAADIIVPLIVGCLPALVTYLLTRRKAQIEPEKLRADAAAALTTAASEFIDDLRQEITVLRERVEVLEAQNREQMQQIVALREALRLAEERIAELEKENRELRAENQTLRIQIQTVSEGDRDGSG